MMHSCGVDLTFPLEDLTHLPEQETSLLAPVDLCSKQLASGGQSYECAYSESLTSCMEKIGLNQERPVKQGSMGQELKTMKHLGALVSS